MVTARSIPLAAGLLAAALAILGFAPAEAIPVTVTGAPIYTIETYPYQKAPALKQWRSVLERDADDEARWNGESCSNGAPELDCAAKQALDLEDKLRSKSPVEQISAVYSYFNAFKYKEHGRNCTEDCWATRLQFIVRREGDCGDHALAEYFTLKRLGFKERDLQLIVAQLPGYEDSFKGGHVVLRVAAAGHYYILDNRRTDLTGLTGLEKYKVLAGLNADSVQIYNLVTPQPPAGFVADETKVAELIDSPNEQPTAEPAVLQVASVQEPTVKAIVQQAALASLPEPAAETDQAATDDTLMDCTQTATLGDWNPNMPCSAFELPEQKVMAKAKPTLVASLTEPPVVKSKAKSEKKTAKTKTKTSATTKTAAAKPAVKTKPKIVQLASAKAEQPKKKKKKKKAVDEGASCVQGASSIADWNPDLPCVSGATASSMKLLDVPPAL